MGVPRFTNIDLLIVRPNYVPQKESEKHIGAKGEHKVAPGQRTGSAVVEIRENFLNAEVIEACLHHLVECIGDFVSPMLEAAHVRTCIAGLHCKRPTSGKGHNLWSLALPSQ